MQDLYTDTSVGMNGLQPLGWKEKLFKMSSKSRRQMESPVQDLTESTQRVTPQRRFCSSKHCGYVIVMSFEWLWVFCFLAGNQMGLSIIDYYVGLLFQEGTQGKISTPQPSECQNTACQVLQTRIRHKRIDRFASTSSF